MKKNKLLWSPLLLLCSTGCREETVIYPERRTLVEAVYASGKLVAAAEHIISAKEAGIVWEKKVQEGDTVKKSQVLYVIETEKNTMRVRSNDKTPLLSAGGISVTIHSGDPVKGKTEIRADAAGIVYQTLKEKGELVRPGEPLLLIGAEGKPLARLMADQQDILKIKTGQLVLVSTESTGDSIYEGEVIKIFPLLQENSQSFRVDVAFKRAPALPFLHLAAHGNIIIQRKENTLVLPASVFSGDSLLVKREGKKQWIKPRTGIRGTDYVELPDGPDEKTKVIVPDKEQ